MLRAGCTQGGMRLVEDNPDGAKTVEEVADEILHIATKLILIGHILGLDRKEQETGKPVVNMCSKAIKKSEMKELKRQNKLIMKRYGRY